MTHPCHDEKCHRCASRTNAMNRRKAHDNLLKHAAHALVRLPNTVVLQIEPYIGFDSEGNWHNAGLHFPGAPAKGPLDLLILHNRQATFLDAKTGNAKLTKVQEQFLRAIARSGVRGFPFHSVEEAIEIIRGSR